MSTVIKVEGLGKQYRLGEVGTGTLSHDLNRWWAKVRGQEDPFSTIGESNDRNLRGNSDYVWALKHINFEVKAGEVLGIIGRNGAGKSTLLKILSKVTKPTVGRILTKGRIASLLEVGTGFHPEMTGRENIFLNGAIMGMTRSEIRKKFDEIIDFAGVERYVDTPVKRYSSGMYVRLAFAVAAHLEPEILIVDEVLAVGDAEFQKKCIGKMQDVSANDGRTVLFVSHNMGAVQSLCKSAIVLSNGLLTYNSENVSDAIYEYNNFNEIQNSVENFNEYSNQYFEIDSLSISDKGGKVKNTFGKDEAIKINIGINPRAIDSYFNIGYGLYNSNNEALFWSFFRDNNDENYKKLSIGSINIIETEIPAFLLNDGNYRIEILAAVNNKGWILEPCKTAPILEFSVQGGNSGFSLVSSTKRNTTFFPIFSHLIKN